MAKVLLAQRYTEYVRSGTNYPASDDAGADFRFWYYVYYDDAQDVANNRTKIITDIYIQSTNGSVDKNSGWSLNLTAQVNGSNYTSALPNKTYYAGTTYTGISKEVWVSHASNGTGSFTWRGLFSGYYSGATTGTTTYTLPTIPRYASITSYSIWNNGLTQIGVYWNANAGCDAVQYSLNGGSWTGTSGNTFYIGNLSPGTQYSVRIRVKRTDSQLWTESGTLYATTTDIAKITNANTNLNVDTGLNVTFNNPSGLRADIFVETLNPTVARTTRTNVTSPYNLQFTEAEKTALFNYSQNTNSFTIRVGVITNNAYWNWKDGTASITNANPTFSNFAYEDTNATTTALTGNNQTIVKGYSNLKATVSTTNKMVANKGAIAKEYQLVVGSKQIKANYSSSADVELTLNAVDNNVFIVYAIDSRGNSTPVQISPASYINYTIPVITSASYSRTGGIGTETTLNFAGSFFNDTFGSVANSVTATYKYKRTNASTWTDGTTTLTLTPDGSAYSCSQTIAGDLGATGFDAANSYDLEISVTDELKTVTASIVVEQGKPNIAFHKNGIAINDMYDETLGGGLQIVGDAIVYNGIKLFEWIDE